jgi:hypothetical protein
MDNSNNYINNINATQNQTDGSSNQYSEENSHNRDEVVRLALEYLFAGLTDEMTMDNYDTSINLMPTTRNRYARSRLFLRPPTNINTVYSYPIVGQTTSDIITDSSNVILNDISNNPFNESNMDSSNNEVNREYAQFLRFFLNPSRTNNIPNFNSPNLNTLMQRTLFDPMQNAYKNVLSEEGEGEIKKVIYKKENYPNESCPITMIDFEEGNEVSQLPCGHIFNNDAILRWLKDEKASCPVCRKPLSSKEVKKEHNQPQLNSPISIAPVRRNRQNFFRNYIDRQIEREENDMLQAAIMASLQDQEQN